MHLHSARNFSKRQRLLMYSTIFISPIAGLLSIIESVIIGSTPNQNKHIIVIPIIVALLSFFTGILNVIINYARYEELISEHRTFAAKFSSLVNNIRRQLNLEAEDRENAGDYLGWIAKNYDELFEMAPLIRENIIDKYVTIAKTKKIPIPEMNDDVTALNLINRNKNIPLEVDKTSINIPKIIDDFKNNEPPKRSQSHSIKKEENTLGNVIIDMNRYDDIRMKYELKRFMNQ